MSEMYKEPEWIIHIGAPRTGTSYLRKHVFPYIDGVDFLNKQGYLGDKQSVSDYFTSIAHAADGDELYAESLVNAGIPAINSRKVLISEEHFLWSVYHMFGNVRGRAYLLKKIVPNAKIIITIRRQPEYLISLFKYLSTLPHWHLHKQMSRIDNMVDFDDEITALNIHKFLSVPCGFDVTKRFKQKAPGEGYFLRDCRHFVSANVSWYKLVEIYRELFGTDHVLVLPQELLKSDPEKWLSNLSTFIGARVSTPKSSLNVKVNTTDAVISPFKSEMHAKKFIETVLAVNSSDNHLIAARIGELDFKSYGYLDAGEHRKLTTRYGFSGNREQLAFSSRLSDLSSIVTRARRAGTSKLIVFVARKLLNSIKPRLKSLLSKGYRKAVGFTDRMNGLDFENIVPLDKLNLPEADCFQYEGTKKFELARILKIIGISEGTVAIDYGSGKGRVVAYLAQQPKVIKVYGVELSSELADVSLDNLRTLKIGNAEILKMDARDLPSTIIDKSNLIYFYNPFPRAVMDTVLSHVVDSLVRCPRELSVVYFNPIYDEAFKRIGAFDLCHEIKNPLSNTAFYVYKYRIKTSMVSPAADLTKSSEG